MSSSVSLYFSNSLVTFSLIFDKENNLYISSQVPFDNSAAIIEISAIDQSVSLFESFYSSGFPYQIEFDNQKFPDGNMYQVQIDSSNNTLPLVKYDASVNRTIVVENTNMGFFLGFAFDHQNRLYHCDSTNSIIYQVDLTTSPATTTAFIIGIPNQLYGIAFDKYDNLYVIYESGSYIAKFNSIGQLLNAFFLSVSTLPFGGFFVNIAIDNINEYIYVAASTALYQFDFNGNLITTVYTDSTNNIYAVGIDNFNNAYFTSDSTNNGLTTNIYKYVPIPKPIPPSPSISLPIPISDTCFPANTLVKTDQGNFPIEKINPKMHTIAGISIKQITRTISTTNYLILFEPLSVDWDKPTRPTIMTPEHRIYYKGRMIEAREWLNRGKKIKKIRYRGEILYNVLMDSEKPMIMNVNGLQTETLNPKNFISLVSDNKSFFMDDKERYVFIQKNNQKMEEKKVSKIPAKNIFRNLYSFQRL